MVDDRFGSFATCGGDRALVRSTIGNRSLQTASFFPASADFVAKVVDGFLEQ
jgi:hypothetical protein